MIIGNDKNETTQVKVPIDNYANKLVWYMKYYLNKLQDDMDSISKKENEKAKIYLKWLIFPNEKEFQKDFRNVEDSFGDKSWNIILHYTKCIMQLVGQLAECVVVDHCCTNCDINRICINIARFMPNIYEDYQDIDYEEYAAFSTSFKYFFYKNSKGIYQAYNVPDYNPNHTSKDIAWCKKENSLSQLKVNLKQIDYLENAKLQIKATLNCALLDLNKYYLTPILCFDFHDDFYKLKKKYPNYIIYSVRQLFPDMYVEMENYFKILAAYAIGLTDHINITEMEIHEDFRLAELFRTPVMDLVKENRLCIADVIEMAEKYGKAVIIGA